MGDLAEAEKIQKIMQESLRITPGGTLVFDRGGKVFAIKHIADIKGAYRALPSIEAATGRRICPVVYAKDATELKSIDTSVLENGRLASVGPDRDSPDEIYILQHHSPLVGEGVYPTTGPGVWLKIQVSGGLRP